MPREGLITIRQAAELANVPLRTMRRRLCRLNDRHGGKLLVSFEAEGAAVRKWMLNPQTLAQLLQTDWQQSDARVEAMGGRISEAEARLLALRGAHRKLRSRVERGFAYQANWNRNLQRWQVGTKQALDGLKAMIEALATDPEVGQHGP